MDLTKTSRSALSHGLVITGSIALAWTAYAISQFWADPLARDFGSFYLSGAAWLAGTPLYASYIQYPNLNPPTVVVLLFAPLALLPVPAAAALWLGIGGIALAYTLRTVFHELRISLAYGAWPIVALSASMGNALAWSQGQLTWMLLVPVTLAWRSLRRGSPFIAGLWLGPAIAAKPFIALVPLVLGWRVTLGAGLASVCLTLLGVLCVGVRSWQEWVELSRVVHWLAWPANASVWGVLSRAAGGGPLSSPLSQLHAAPVVGAIVLLVSGAVLSRRLSHTPDRHYLAAICLALLASPLGWVYYVPWILGPYLAVAIAKPSWVDRLALGLLIVPMPILGLVAHPPWLFAIAGSVYAWGLVLIWWRAFHVQSSGNLLTSPGYRRSLPASPSALTGPAARGVHEDAKSGGGQL